MIKCQVCGKECKTVQGLAGHMQNKHGILGAYPDAERMPPSPKLVSEQQLSELVERVDELEDSVGAIEAEYRAGGLGKRAEQSKELTERDAALLKQLSGRLNKTAELARNNAEQLKNIAQSGKRSVLGALLDEISVRHSVFDKFLMDEEELPERKLARGLQRLIEKGGGKAA